MIARVVKYPQDGGSGVAKVERLLDPDKPVTLATEAAIAKLSLPRDFSPQATTDAVSHGTEVDAAEAGRRVDLRSLPLVTIDGEDARDFDDAVFAEATPEGFGWWWRSPMSVTTCAKARSWMPRRASVALRCISRAAWCRCCRRRFRMSCAR